MVDRRHYKRCSGGQHQAPANGQVSPAPPAPAQPPDKQLGEEWSGEMLSELSDTDKKLGEELSELSDAKGEMLSELSDTDSLQSREELLELDTADTEDEGFCDRKLVHL